VNYPRSYRWWQDGLVWSCLGLVAMGALVGFAVAMVVTW